MTQDLSEVFALGVRDVVPHLQQRGVGYAHAECGTEWLVDDESAGLLGRSFGHLYRPLPSMLQQGCLAFDALARPARAGGCTLRVRVGGAAPLRVSDEVLRQWGLQLEPDPHESHLQRARGLCPTTGAKVSLAWLPRAGFLLGAEYALRGACRLPLVSPAMSARWAVPRVWIVGGGGHAGAVALRQAIEHGASALLMPAPADAMRRLRAHDHADRQPTLLLVVADAATSLDAVFELRAQLPAAARCVLAVTSGSPWLGALKPAEGVEVACHPFAARQWQRWLAPRRADARGTPVRADPWSSGPDVQAGVAAGAGHMHMHG